MTKIQLDLHQLLTDAIGDDSVHIPATVDIKELLEFTDAFGSEHDLQLLLHDNRLPCRSFDLRSGQDAADPASYAGLAPIDFVWMHPPYWRMIRYNDDPRCLSAAPTLDAFLDRMQQVLRNCKGVLSPRGKIAVLLGGFSDRGRYQPLPQLLFMRAIDEGLWPACTEIIRFQYGNTSSQKEYRSSFIPGLHDTCLVLERRSGR